MSLFSWLSRPSRRTQSATHDDRGHSNPSASALLGGHGRGKSEDAKNHRHVRREELYVAIREAMTRSGVLSARFKFKVLSLDQQGNTFLVMMDLTTESGAPAASLSNMEKQITRQAMARFDIAVSSVYWRLDDSVNHQKSDSPQAPKSHERADDVVRALPVYKTIEVDELAAFKEARLIAAQKNPSGTLPAPAAPKIRRSASQQPDFADTQLNESANAPGLSATQYGDLN